MSRIMTRRIRRYRIKGRDVLRHVRKPPDSTINTRPNEHKQSQGINPPQTTNGSESRKERRKGMYPHLENKNLPPRNSQINQPPTHASPS